MPGAPPPLRPPGPRWLSLTAGALLLALWPAAALDLYTPGTLEVLNGTDVRLKCTFSSDAPLGKQTVVSWLFRPQEKGPDEFVFYYHEGAYPPSTGRFSGRVTWDGNTAKGDASILLWSAGPTDNGTFVCQVRNPPDVEGGLREIQLRVVLTVSLSEIHLLALTIGCACALMIVTVVVVVVCRHQRKTRQERTAEAVQTELAEKKKLKNSREEMEVLEPGAKV